MLVCFLLMNLKEEVVGFFGCRANEYVDTWALYGSVSLMMKDCIGSVDATGQINILKALGEE